MNIFEELNFLNNEILTIQENLSDFDLYLWDILEKSYKNMPEIKYASVFYDLDYLEYNDLVIEAHKNILHTCMTEFKTLKENLTLLREIRHKLTEFIITKSLLTENDFKSFLNIYNLTAPLSNIFINNDGIIVLNKIYEKVFTQDMIDFIKYYINAKYSQTEKSLLELYQEYNNMPSLNKEL